MVVEMPGKLDLDDLVRRAKIGQVTKAEIVKVANALEGDAGTATYRLLYVLARTGSREYEDLVAKYIQYPEDPQVAALSLSSLCLQWKLFTRYRDRVIEALDGVEWDFLEELKHAGISVAGEYLREASDPAVMARLIAIAVMYEDDLSGRFAIEALARALGEPHSESVFPRAADEGRAWAQSILERAEGRLALEHARGDE